MIYKELDDEKEVSGLLLNGTLKSVYSKDGTVALRTSNGLYVTGVENVERLGDERGHERTIGSETGLEPLLPLLGFGSYSNRNDPSPSKKPAYIV